MQKPIHENLAHVSVINDDGEYLPLMEEAGAQLRGLLRAVEKEGKQGTMTIRLAVKPSIQGSVAVSAEVVTKTPMPKQEPSLLWATPEGNLITEDPRQRTIDDVISRAKKSA